MVSGRVNGTILLAVATILIGFALQINDGFYTLAALSSLIAAAVLAAVGMARMSAADAMTHAPRDARPEATLEADAEERVRRARAERLLIHVLIVGLGVGLVWATVAPPGNFLTHPRPSDHPFFLACLAAAAIVIGLLVWQPRRAWTIWFPLLLAIAAAMGAWIIDVSPRPHIDVVTVHKMAISALRSGHNPYDINFPNIYGLNEDLYPPGAVQGGYVKFGLPYPPLSLFMTALGQIAGRDIRWAELASVLIGAALVFYAVRRCRAAGAADSPERTLAAALGLSLLLYTPRGLFVLEHAWTDPLAIVWLGATLYAAIRSPRALPWMLALLVCVKQHLVLALPLALLLLPRPFDWRAAVRLLWPSIALPAALALPFLIWHPRAFIDAVVLLQLQERFRTDSLSLLGFLWWHGDVDVFQYPRLMLLMPLGMLLLAFAIVFKVAPRTPAGFAASLGFVLLLLFMGSKKAFVNYYYLVIAAFSFAIATAHCQLAAWRDDGASRS